MSIQTETPVHRPGCVTLYAFLGGLGGTLGFLILMIILVSDASALPLLAYPLGIIFSVLNLAIAAGLWEMKHWARAAVILLTGLEILGNVVSLCVGTLDADFGSLIGNLLAIAVGAYIIYWFDDNRDLFQ